ncbi:MAG: hypothetical protein WA005_01870 [Candidatus Binataceae bacterium]
MIRHAALGKSFGTLLAAALAALVAAAGCTPNTAMDFGPVGEITTPPQDELSRRILREFDGRDFTLGHNDREAEVRLSDWAPGRRVVLPFWFGVNPLMPGFLRPKLGYIYVMSESMLVRPLGNSQYLIRAGSKLFKCDTVFEAGRAHYLDTGKMLPTVVRFVGTAVITVPKDAPATGTVTEKVPVLREVSLPMRVDEPLPGYAKFEVRNRA